MSEESVINKHVWYRQDVRKNEWSQGILLKLDVADDLFEGNYRRRVMAIVKNTKTGMMVVVPAHLGINFNSDPKNSN